ncbi:hypothetical protein BS78_05G285400 [Paspalum vaginatum]|nr:hypothetical protein BS78_05G285400 [Paspalum vaginatum]
MPAKGTRLRVSGTRRIASSAALSPLRATAGFCLLRCSLSPLRRPRRGGRRWWRRVRNHRIQPSLFRPSVAAAGGVEPWKSPSPPAGRRSSTSSAPCSTSSRTWSPPSTNPSASSPPSTAGPSSRLCTPMPAPTRSIPASSPTTAAPSLTRPAPRAARPCRAPSRPPPPPPRAARGSVPASMPCEPWLRCASSSSSPSPRSTPPCSRVACCRKRCPPASPSGRLLPTSPRSLEAPYPLLLPMRSVAIRRQRSLADRGGLRWGSTFGVLLLHILIQIWEIVLSWIHAVTQSASRWITEGFVGVPGSSPIMGPGHLVQHQG